MNVYEWLESPDVREYLEGIHYEFTLPEAFYVIRENQQRALEEKIAAWEELLDIMPDCPFSIESELGEKLEIDSFHQALREYVAQQRGLLEDVCRRDENGVYGVIMPTAYRKAKGVALSEFLENNWNEFESKVLLRVEKTWTGKQRHNGILCFYVNAEKQVTEIVPDLSYRTHPLQSYWLPLPTPFHRGDILELENGTPVVLDFIGSWNEEKLLENSLCSPIFDRGKRKGAAIYQFSKVREKVPWMIVSCFVQPHQLQYYRKPLKESEWVLRAVSSYLKGNLDLGQMCMAYYIFAKEREARSLREEFIESMDEDIACAAGLESSDVQETIGRYSP